MQPCPFPCWGGGPAGTLWGTGTNFNNASSCLPCPEKTYRTIENATCLFSDPGYYVDERNKTAQQPCPAGKPLVPLLLETLEVRDKRLGPYDEKIRAEAVVIFGG